MAMMLSRRVLMRAAVTAEQSCVRRARWPAAQQMRFSSDSQVESVSQVESLCDQVCQLNVLELKQFLDLFKERAGLSDADLAGGGGGGGGGVAPVAAAPAEEEAPAAVAKEFFDIKLTGFDPKVKIKVIKEIR